MIGFGIGFKGCCRGTLFPCGPKFTFKAGKLVHNGIALGGPMLKGGIIGDIMIIANVHDRYILGSS